MSKVRSFDQPGMPQSRQRQPYGRRLDVAAVVLGSRYGDDARSQPETAGAAQFVQFAQAENPRRLDAESDADEPRHGRPGIFAVEGRGGKTQRGRLVRLLPEESPEFGPFDVQRHHQNDLGTASSGGRQPFRPVQRAPDFENPAHWRRHYPAASPPCPPRRPPRGHSSRSKARAPQRIMAPPPNRWGSNRSRAGPIGLRSFRPIRHVSPGARSRGQGESTACP